MSGNPQSLKPAIHVQDVSVHYGSTTALTSVTLDIPSQSMTAIIGPNGSGKSSLLKSILSLLPYSGEIRFESGKTLDQMRKRLAYVPQRIEVDWQFPASVSEVVEMGRFVPGALFQRLSAQDHHAVQEALEKTGLKELSKRPVGALSGGQQQRVFIARALAKQADLILMDEPFAGIDRASEENIWQVLSALRAEGKTLVLVHHDLQSIPTHFDHAVLLNGRCIASGSIAQVMQPELLNAAYYPGIKPLPAHA
jgi:manganese/zinc/iron transport system ATP- binding protein